MTTDLTRGTRRSRSWIGRTLLFLGAVALSSALYLNFCDWIYDCGCQAWWSGGVTECNIHDASTHDCPWCSHGFVGGYLPLALVLVGHAAGAFLRYPGGWLTRILVTLLAFPVIGGLTGLAYGLVDGYWSA